MQHYATRTGLDVHMPALTAMVSQVVEQLHVTEHVYRDRKYLKTPPLTSLGWSERHENYRWPSGNDADPERLCAAFEPLARAVDSDSELTSEQLYHLRDLARSTFIWGKVFKVRKKTAEGAEVASVIQSALNWNPVTLAPMDAGWTKVAAFATAWIEAIGRPPQAIYDSRVAAALIRNVDTIIYRQPPPAEVQTLLLTRLRIVPARGDARFSGTKLRWKRASNRWDAQLFGSLLVILIRDALNAKPAHYGKPGAQSKWTVRAVEKVLFMEGY